VLFVIHTYTFTHAHPYTYTYLHTYLSEHLHVHLWLATACRVPQKLGYVPPDVKVEQDSLRLRRSLYHLDVHCVVKRRQALCQCTGALRDSFVLVGVVVVAEAFERAPRPVGCICTACICTACICTACIHTACNCTVLFFLIAWPRSPAGCCGSSAF
jgi:hypothetical protein